MLYGKCRSVKNVSHCRYLYLPYFFSVLLHFTHETFRNRYKHPVLQSFHFTLNIGNRNVVTCLKEFYIVLHCCNSCCHTYNIHNIYGLIEAFCHFFIQFYLFLIIKKNIRKILFYYFISLFLATICICIIYS